MSDWSMLELDDITWNTFGDNCNRMVLTSAVQVNNFEAQDNTHKKARHDILNFKDWDVDRSSGSSFHANQETGLQSSLSDEKSQTVYSSDASKNLIPFSHAPAGVDEATLFASNGTNVFSECFNSHITERDNNDLVSDDSTFKSTIISGEGNLCKFSIQESPSELDFVLPKNEHEDRENREILDHDWHPNDSFDDVDKMLSYATFGQAGSENADEVSWLSSSYTVDGCENMYKTGLQSVSDVNALRKTSQNDLIVWPDSDMQTVDDQTTSLDYDSFMQWLGLDVKEKTNVPSKNEGKNALDNNNQIKPSEYASGSSYTVAVPDTVVRHDNQIYLSSSFATEDPYFPNFAGSQVHSVESDYSGYPPVQNPCVEIQQSFAPQEITTDISTSLIRSRKEKKSMLLIQPVEASDSGDNSTKIIRPVSNPPTLIAEKKIDEMHLKKQFPTEAFIGYHEQKYLNLPGVTNPISMQKQLHQLKTQIGRNNPFEKDSQEQPRDGTRLPCNLGNSCNDWTEDILSSPRTFQQLQGVMNQLDIRTKLCIRDGLYRLAKSAEQRQNVESPKPQCRFTMDSAKCIAIDKSKRCNGYMDVDMETGTNPIDRSIVHLLFRRTSEHPSCSSGEAMPQKSC